MRVCARAVTAVVILAVGWAPWVAGCLKDFSSPPIPPGCGNGVLEAGELCDGTDFAGNTCAIAMGTEFGELRCTEACLLDFTDCHNCGNGVVDPGEDCDDGNGDSVDGCSRRCQLEPGWLCDGEPSTCAEICGDGLVVGQEGCDDANATGGDGCSEACTPEPGWVCAGQPSVCVETCGDGVVESPEACDDGNLTEGDGCSPSCVVEDGWVCDGAPSVCAGVCGDGQLVGAETCDDGNLLGGDGCLPDCTVEPGWTCDYVSDPPAGCTPLCGDGLVVGGETCDDGNLLGGDGCAPGCLVETYSACHGAPSLCVCVVHVDVDAAQTALQNGASWATAFGDLRDGLQAAGYRAPCEVWVAEGVYYTYDGSAGNRLEPPSDVALYGGFTGTETWRSQRDFVAQVTVLSAEQEGNPNNRVRRIVDVAGRQGVVIDGFTISGALDTSGEGGGLRVQMGSEVSVRNCRFEDNAAEEGGAVYLRDGTLTISDSTFLSNSAGQVGGAISLGTGASLVVERCLFAGNTAGGNGGAICVDDTEQLTVDRCRFRQNTSGGYGGAIRLAGGALLADIVGAAFWQNTSVQGGGAISIYSLSQPVTVTNCSFLDNDPSPGIGASLRGQLADAVVTNSILWGSSGTQIFSGIGSNIDLEHCDVQGGATGVGVFDSDPLFVAPASGDLHLQALSPCIDAADGDLAPATDLDGNPLVDLQSVTNSGVGTPDYADLGAYEYQP